MIWAILAFAFVGLGSKILLGMAAIWVFLPDQPECARCDGETTQIATRRGLRTLYRWCRIQERWCPRCGETFLARGAHPPRLWVGLADEARVPDPVGPPQVAERRPQ